MSRMAQKGGGTDLEAPTTGRPPGSVRRLGSAIGLVTLMLVDLLALDDITTAGAWMPEIAFVIASVPAIITLAYFTFRRTPSERVLENPAARRRLIR